MPGAGTPRGADHRRRAGRGALFRCRQSGKRALRGGRHPRVAVHRPRPETNRRGGPPPPAGGGGGERGKARGWGGEATRVSLSTPQDKKKTAAPPPPGAPVVELHTGKYAEADSVS